MRFIPASLLVLACLASEAATRSARITRSITTPSPPLAAAEATVATPLTSPPGTVPAMTGNSGGYGSNSYVMPQYDNNGHGQLYNYGYQQPYYYGQLYYYGYQQPYYYTPYASYGYNYGSYGGCCGSYYGKK